MKKPWRSAAMAEPQEPSPASPTRSKTEARSIRGRISGPIPIPSPLDDEFSMQKHTPNGHANGNANGNGVVGPPALAAEPTAEPRNDIPEPGATAPNHRHLSTSPPDVSQRRVKVAQDVQGDGALLDAPSSLANTAQAGHKRNQSSNLRVSTFSVGSTSGSRDKPNRKKSTLRGAIGRLFGRNKKRSPSQASTWFTSSTRPTPDGSTPHRDELTPLPDNDNHNLAHKRSASLPPSEYGKALRSHSIGPEDRLAIESVRNSLQAGSNFSRRHPGTQSFRARRNKTGEPAGLTPRPASIIGGVAGFDREDDNPETIGRAISDDTTGLKRRSQSLSALVITARNLHGEPRRLSGEIRYWRDSQEPEYKSPVSSSHPEVEVQDYDDEQNEPAEEPAPHATVEPFRFPDVSTLSELSSMKITEAATMEQRLRSLESKTEGLEKTVKNLNAVCDLGGASNPAQRNQTQPTSLSGNSMRRGSGATGGKPQARHAYRRRHASRSSSDSGDGYVLDAQPVRAAQNRPLSTATVRGATSLPSLSKDTSRPLTMDHYTTLMALLDTERSARLALEDKVKMLSHQLSVMSRTAEIAREANGFGPSNPSLGSAFDYDDDDEELGSPRSLRRVKTNVPSRRLERGPDKRETRAAAAGVDDNGDDDGYASTSYATPHEDETDDDTGAGHKKTDRTLSLSQMTMKRPQP